MGERVPALDGLRGVAILLVLGSHAADLVAPGLAGVSLFFVLSGYLITGRLTSRQPLRAFYLRRAVRLVPALLVMIALTQATYLAVGWHSLSWAWEPLTWTKNLTASFGHARNTPYLHTWSLALEEQFYLVWPVLFVAFGRRKWMPAALAATVAGSLAALGWAHAVDAHDVAAFSPMTTVWGLALGCLVRLRQGTLPGPSWAWLRWFGLRSYGIYLWHLPMIWFMAPVAPGIWRGIFGVTLGVMAGAASYRWVERPFLRFKDRGDCGGLGRHGVPRQELVTGDVDFGVGQRARP